MRRPGSGRTQPIKTTKRRRTGRTVRLVPTINSIPLVDLGIGAEVSIRFAGTGPSVEIMRVSKVPADWAGHLVATVLATKSSKC
jgi:hypothetical protein